MRRHFFTLFLLLLYFCQIIAFSLAITGRLPDWRLDFGRWVALLLPQLLLFLTLLAFIICRYSRRRQLVHSQQVLLAQVLEHLPCAVFVKDVADDLRYTYVNSTYRNLYFQQEANIKGQKTQELWSHDPVFMADLRQEDLELIKRGGIMESGREWALSSGARSAVRYIKSVVEIDGRQYLIGACSDVTTSDEARLRMEERQGILQELLDHMPASIMVKDASDDFRYVVWNKELENLTGVPAAAVLGKNDFEINAFPGMSEVFRARDLEVLASGDTKPFIEYCSTATGKRLVLNTFKGLLQMPSGRTFIFDLCLDETKQHELEDEREAIIELLNNMVKNERIVNVCLQKITVESDFDVAVHDLLSLMGQDAGTDVYCVFQFKDTPTNSDPEVIYHWLAPEAQTFALDLQQLGARHGNNFRRLMEERRDLVLPNMTNPVPAFSGIANAYRDFGVKSALATGIWIDNQLWGFLGMYYLAKPHLFTMSDIHTIHDAANLFKLAHERHRQMNELAESSFLHRQIFDTVNMPMAMIDFNYNIIMANAYCQQHAVNNQQDLTGKKCYLELCRQQSPPSWCPLRTALRTKQLCQVECVTQGTHLLVMAQPIYDRTGKVLSMLEIALDTTELHQQKHQLEVNNLLLNRAAEMAQMMYFRGERNGSITWLGGNVDLGIAPHASVLLHEWVVPEDAAKVNRACLELTEGRSTVTELILCSEKMGGRRSLRLRMSSLEQPDGTFFGIMQDITLQTEMEKVQNDLIQRLNNYIENERVLNSCLAQSVLEDDFDKNVRAVLQIIATQLRCERVLCGLFEDDSQNFAQRYELGVNSLSVQLSEQLSAELPVHHQRWQNSDSQELIKLVDVSQVGGGGALLCGPIRVQGDLLGILQFEYAGSRQFTDLDEGVLRSAARIISLAKEREMQRLRLDASIRERQIIYNHIMIPIMLFDQTGGLLSMNPAAEEWYGRTESEAQGQSFLEVFASLEPTPGLQALHAATHGDKTFAMDVQWQENSFILNIESTDAKTEDEQRLIASLVDVTALVESKRHLEEAMRAAQAAERAKSYFLATMSHELRTPLNSVIGFSELLQQSTLVEERRQDYLRSINLAGKALLNLISDILDLSKIEANQMIIQPQRCQMIDLIGDVYAIFEHEAREKGLELVVECPDDLPDMYLDSLRLRQVLLNLVGNAIKFTGIGKVEVKVDFQSGGQKRGSDGRLQIVVKDTGIGIEEENLQTIFDPFVQEDDARGNRAYDGSGLGLAISKRLVDRMGGALEVESKLQQGSCFQVTLNEVQFEPQARKKDSPPTELQALLLPPEPLRVLVVDDVELNLRVIESMLKNLGVKPECARSGQEALMKMAEEKFDCVFTDMWMSGMNGEELARNIRKLPDGSKTKIYAVTADIEARDNFDLQMFDDVLLKPIVMDTLKKLFEKC